MRPDLTTLLDEALERLRAGASIEECLRAYPEHAADLEPMLRTADAIRRQAVAALPPSLEQWLASGRSEIEQIARATYTRRETPFQRLVRRLSNAAARLLRRSGPRMASVALSAVVILFMTFSAVDGAAARSLPGEYLYGWKLFAEETRIAMTGDPDRRAQLVAASVERRVAEIEALADSGQASPELIAETVARLESQVDQTLTALPQASATTSERTTARLGRLLARAESELRAASAPDEGAAQVIKMAAANVADLKEDLPTEVANEPAETDPLLDATPEVEAQNGEGQGSPPAPTAPPIVIVGPPAGGAIPSPSSTPEPAQAVAPTSTPTVPSNEVVVIPPAPTTGPTLTDVPTRTPQATRTPAPTLTASPEPTPTEATATATNTPVPPTATATNTPVPPTATATNTPVPPTATATNTPVPPTATATNTPVPPTATATNTPVPPTATATNTPVPPTATATNTSVPPTATATNMPIPPTPTVIGDNPTASGLRPLLECVAPQPDGSYLAVFGYRNNSDSAITAAIGPDNAFIPGPRNRGQPIVFAPGQSDPFPTVFFSVTFESSWLTWSLGGNEVTATRDTRPCPVTTPTP